MSRCVAAFLFSTALTSSTFAQDEVSLSLDGDFTLELLARWDSMTDSVYGFEKQYELVRNLKPAHERLTYPADVFRAFLPDEAMRVGDFWKLDPELFVGLLAQLHPGVTHELHHAGGGDWGIAVPGAWACLRALGPKYAEVRLRVHVDFLLDGDGTREQSSWLTPAQFDGTLIIDREKEVAHAFELALPFQSANADLNIATEFGLIADIGRIPKMELRTEAPLLVSGYDREITVEQAELLLRRQFYPIADVDWFELEEAFEESVSTGKPLHVLVMFGSLIDESC